MFDTMTGVKIVGAFCGALLVLLLGGWAAETIYHVGASGHGDEVHQAYTIPVEDAGGEEEAEAEVPFDQVFAAADAAEGEKLWRQCGTCHKLDGSNATGPHLDGVVDREIGGVEGFDYSDAMAGHGDNWTPENLYHFLQDPDGWVPGTKMTYRGLADSEDRANLIAYLAAQGG
jgi:cytochrome c